MGIEKPTSGTIYFNGVDITGLEVSERAKLGISYGFQQPPRLRGISVSELLSIASGTDLPHDKCCEYLTAVGLCSMDYLNREVDSGLSGGEMKRIEIATILARNTKLAIFDEPEAGIDLWSFTKLTETFRTLHDEQNDSSMIIISHQEKILEVADEIVVVSGGSIQDRGSREEMMTKIMGDVSCGECSYIAKTLESINESI
jgi:Fe-S cluster assembly ATP-binding protein